MAMLFCDVVVAIDHRERRAWHPLERPPRDRRPGARRAGARRGSRAVAARCAGRGPLPAAVARRAAEIESPRSTAPPTRRPSARRRLHPGRRHLPGQPVPALRGRLPAGLTPFDLYPAPAARATPRRSRPTWRSAMRRRLGARPSASCAWATGGSRPGRSRAPARAAPRPSEDARAGRRAAGQREGPRRERDDRRPAAQRPVRASAATAACGARAVRARELRHRAPSGLDASTARLRAGLERSICCGRPSRAARSPARPRSAPWRSSPSWSRRGAGPIAARSASWASTARWTPASPSAPSPSAGGGWRSRPAAGSWPTRDPAAEYEETLAKARALMDGPAAAPADDPPDRQLRLVRPQPGALRARAGPADHGGPQRRAHRGGRRPRWRPSHIIVSPGPVHARRGRDLATRSSPGFGGTVPILGVCLGHQAIGAGLRRAGGAGAPPDARQDLRDPPRRQRASSAGCRSRCGRPATTRWWSRRRACR